MQDGKSKILIHVGVKGQGHELNFVNTLFRTQKHTAFIFHKEIQNGSRKMPTHLGVKKVNGQDLSWPLPTLWFWRVIFSNFYLTGFFMHKRRVVIGRYLKPYNFVKYSVLRPRVGILWQKMPDTEYLIRPEKYVRYRLYKLQTYKIWITMAFVHWKHKRTLISCLFQHSEPCILTFNFSSMLFEGAIICIMFKKMANAWRIGMPSVYFSVCHKSHVGKVQKSEVFHPSTLHLSKRDISTFRNWLNILNMHMMTYSLL